jgi:diguanylate cyclase (GGDEF)-like protein
MAFRRLVPRRGSLLLTFGISALVVTVLAGFAIHYFARSAMRERAIGDARQAAQELTFNIQSAVAAAPRSPLDQARLKSIVRRELAAGYGPMIPTRVTLIGTQPVTVDASRAPTGSRGSPAQNGTPHLLTFRTPVRLAPGRGGIGVIETAFPYPRVVAKAEASVRRLDLLVAACLALLYVAMFLLARKAGAAINAELSHRDEQARRDPLTSLPNREQLHHLVHEALMKSRRSKQKVALMLMDLNRFKEINDTLGHHTGDRVLQQLAARLRNVMRDSETVARLGGDEFAILLPAIGDRAEAATVAQRILKTLEEPFVAAGVSLEVDASIGIALFPEHGDRVAKLLRAADVAMYLGKETLSGYTFFNQGSDPADGGRRLALISELRTALEDGQLVLYYQPKMELTSGKITGVEALVRWQHPRGGLLAPDEFIPLLEQSSLLRQFTLYIVEMALHDCNAWRSAGLNLQVAVNLSMRNLLDAQLPTDLRKLIHHSANLRSDALELEITESMILSDPERIFRVCTALRELGFQLTVDDFGTGYSSLAYLQRLPVSSLKIDKSFVTAMAAGDGDSEAIVRSTLDLANNLGLAVVAEGVETEAVCRRLTELGCGHAQGFFISRPLPNEELVAWLRSGAGSTRGRPLQLVTGKQTAAATG